MWSIWNQQQHRGAQFGPGERGRKPGEAPAEAVAEREVQDHDYADLDTSIDHQPRADLEYPAEQIAASEQDNTPTAPDAQVEWDDVVQPERKPRDNPPAPSGERR